MRQVTVPSPKTTAARVAALRERRAAEGLTRLELWARPEHHDRIRRYAAKLAKSPSIRQIPKVLDGT
jgi:hypothetical protein